MEEIFDSSGPKHLEGIVDWKNADHRRSVTASLVQGVYVLETDRQRKMTISKNPINYAQPWWVSFNFQLHKYLTKDDGCIFGAIYEYINGKCPAPADSNVPRYVIAFRGTLILRLRDLKLNLKFFINELKESHRSQLAMRCVENFVDSNGSSNVWLAGHSLGSAIALIVGRNMMLKKNCSLEAYLFNPPYASLHMENFCTSMDEDVKHLVRTVRGIIKKALAIAVEARINP
ncbi:GDSL esterase/lipase At4g10955-like [Juglans microcarpa x Juglans regia]|uniref:GDSL esterase/lipase At4g10955-like n=1 Tax=Juglans microcarpa x Juglans regia TaxID=2249226 RepID=UPI001B7D9637|nr:GDSL esterase/lipase At4g10955-like [Juglans microcarpa x Juglans regia]